MKLKTHRIAIFLFLLVSDIFSIILAFWAAYKIRFYSGLIPVTKGIPDWKFYEYTLYFAAPLFLVIFYVNDFYKVYFLPALDEFIRATKAATLGMILVVLAVFFYKEFEFSRATFVVIWFLLISIIFVIREIFKISARFVIRQLSGLERILIVGKKNNLLRSLLKTHGHLDVFYLVDEGSKSIEDIKKYAGEKDISQVLLLHMNFSQVDLMNFYDWCELRGIELKILPNVVQICMGETTIDTSLGVPMLHIKPVNLSGFNFYFKRFIDVFLSMIFLSLFWPFLFLVSVLIKIDSPGPIFYHHKRVGYRGRQFEFYKFRSMVVNADALLHALKEKSERKGPVFKMANDPRVTKLGRFIRRFSIDEIPQIFNVLRGEMSLVGPRPQVLWEAAHYDDWAKRRLRVLPGITGLWQVSGRANLSYEEMIELDIYYIENWSLGLDIKILFKTFFVILSARGAC